MKKIEAVIKPFKLDEVKQALENKNVRHITIFEVKGAGSEQATPNEYRGVRYAEDAHQVKIEVIAEDDDARQVAEAIVSALRTGDLCEGEVSVIPMETVLRVLIGQQSPPPPNWQEPTRPAHFMTTKITFRSCLRSLRIT